jgi:hypothetical protein
MNDSIPDSWRLRYFGTVANILSHANADADGDGVPNWQEFRSGTNPTDLRSVLRLLSAKQKKDGVLAGMTLRWPTVSGKRYIIERSSSLMEPDWQVISAPVTGGGFTSEFTDQIGDPQYFYRVRLAE